ncbi:TonB-dependent receptor [Candidatus Pelagibacter sp.]|nr:TonB-dependent receptor [Candidatus Pelagibacter sp.]
MLLRIYVFIFLLIFSSKVYSENIPVIVINASKKPQSLSTVGTSVTTLDEKFFNNSTEYFLGDALSTSTTGANFFQSGGHGTSSAIQLRGMPKRYSTVYIDGVKMSDPSSVSNDFDFNNILTSQVASVEILKGNQSSIYGSGAIGGTIHITTKKGEPGFKKDLNYTTGSHDTHNLSGSVSGGDENINYYVGLQRFQTDGISQMTHNDEKDRYRNNGLVASFSNEFSDTLGLQSNARVSETYLQYDAACVSSAFGCSSTRDHSEEADGLESSTNISLIHKPIDKLTNKFTVANTYIERVYSAAPGSKNTKQDNYYGERYAYLYQGNYNFNLDNSIVFGLEREDDQMGFNKDEAGRVDSSSHVTSQYFDYQSRITKNIYGTFGARFDEHSFAGNEDSHRATLAYVFDDKTTKLKSSYGTGYRFPSLYETFYVWNSANNCNFGGANCRAIGHKKAETSQSYDFGIEKSINPNLFIDLTYFNVKYFDALEGWKGNTAAGSASTTQNSPGTSKSEGLEFMSKFKLNEMLNFGFNYTYTQTYDGAEYDDPDNTNSGSQMVRVPRNIMNLITNVKVPGYKDLDITLRTKWSDEARDYGNGNPNRNGNTGNSMFNDAELESYLVNDLSIRYNYLNSYNLFFDITNITDKKYETAQDYSQMDRSFNFGMKKSY